MRHAAGPPAGECTGGRCAWTPDDSVSPVNAVEACAGQGWQSKMPLMKSQKDQDSLYRRLGGYDIIAAIIADQFRLLKEDERFRRFAQGRGLDSRARAQQLT